MTVFIVIILKYKDILFFTKKGLAGLKITLFNLVLSSRSCYINWIPQ